MLAASFLADIVAELRAAGVPFIFLGDIEKLSVSTEGDVDLMTDVATERQIHRVIRRLCVTLNAECIQEVRHEAQAHYFVLTRRTPAGRREYLKLDICGDYVRNARCFLRADELVPHARDVSRVLGGNEVQLPINADHLAFIYYLIKRIDKRQLGDESFRYLRKLWTSNEPQCRCQLQRHWDAGSAARIAETFSQNDATGLSSELDNLCAGLRRQHRRTLRTVVAEARRVLLRLIQPTGLCIVLEGVDGCGKSTLLHPLKACLAPAFWHTVTWHFRPMALVPANANAAAQAKTPQSSPPRSRLASIAKLSAYLLDYLWGWGTIVLPALIRTTFVIFDRYRDDLVVDPYRFRLQAPLAFRAFIRRCIPSPHIVLYLHAPPSVIYTRKQELTLKELERQSIEYLRLVQGDGERTCLLDATQSPEGVLKQAEDRLVTYLANRYARRHG